MRRLLILSLLGLSCAVHAVGPEDFESVVDLGMSTARLSELVAAGRYDLIDPERFFILTGSVASTLVLDDQPETFKALVELVDARWDDLASISVFRIYVLLEGPEYAPRLPTRMPANPGPEVITANQRLLVVASFLGEAEDLRGPGFAPVPVVLAIAVR